MSDAVIRAEMAQARSEGYRKLADSELLKEVIESVREEAITTWRSTGPTESETREDAWQMLRAIDRIERTLRSRADDGAVVAHNARTALRKLGR